MPSYTTRKIADPKAQAALEVEASRLGTKTETHPAIPRLRSIVPFDFYAISGIDYHGLGIGSGVMLAADMPEAFLRQFLDQGFFRVDPMATRITRDHVWSSWHDLTPDELASADLAPIRRLENSHGITTRSCVGFYRGDFRYGGATFCRATPFSDDELLILEAVARLVHADVSACRMARMAAHAGLSEGEIACLKSAADGMSAADAVTATGYTEETIASYIKSATRKLGCANRTHAVAEAVRRRLFD